MGAATPADEDAEAGGGTGTGTVIGAGTGIATGAGVGAGTGIGAGAGETLDGVNGAIGVDGSACVERTLDGSCGVAIGAAGVGSGGLPSNCALPEFGPGAVISRFGRGALGA